MSKRILALVISALLLFNLASCEWMLELPNSDNEPDGNISDSTSDSGENESSTENGTAGDETQKDEENGSADGKNPGEEQNPKPEEESKEEPDEEIPESDPYVNVDKTDFYENYKPATSYMDSYYRTQHGLMSGSIEVPEQMFTPSDYRPTVDGKFLRNSKTVYRDNGKTYVVYDAYGEEVMKIYKGAAYITLEEVAAYMYAFGGNKYDLPANYVTSKSTKPTKSIWGEYLRLNHSSFSGDTSRYPYEPKLPNIKGSGGSLQYYEMDIGTTGTTTPGYNPSPYNNGKTIVRGAARLVYGRYDLNLNGVFDEGELYVFYTHNHYNDFTEYLNYFGGWGETFGNITGGGVFDSDTECNPTPYVHVYMGTLGGTKAVVFIVDYGKKSLFAA